MLYSDDEGETWQPNENGEMFIITEPGGPFHAAYEPSVVEVTPGNLMMIVRTRLGRLFQAFSEDNGTTWSRLVPTQLAGTHAPIDRHQPQRGRHLGALSERRVAARGDARRAGSDRKRQARGVLPDRPARRG